MRREPAPVAMTSQCNQLHPNVEATLERTNRGRHRRSSMPHSNMNLTRWGPSIPYPFFSLVNASQKDADSKRAATPPHMNLTRWGPSIPYSPLSLANPSQKDAESKREATPSHMNVTSWGPSIPYSTFSLVNPSQFDIFQEQICR